MSKLNFQQPLLQSSVSHDSSENHSNIMICSRKMYYYYYYYYQNKFLPNLLNAKISQ